jgi:hypothetical protein
MQVKDAQSAAEFRPSGDDGELYRYIYIWHCRSKALEHVVAQRDEPTFVAGDISFCPIGRGS